MSSKEKIVFILIVVVTGILVVITSIQLLTGAEVNKYIMAGMSFSSAIVVIISWVLASRRNRLIQK